MNGVSRIIPVETLQEAEDFKKRGWPVAAERDGLVQPFADFGNSPFNFTRERVSGRQIVYSTTNGTQAIHEPGCYRVVIGAYLNFTALADWLIVEKRHYFCAAGRINSTLKIPYLQELWQSGVAESDYTICDSALV
jgi:2-phosphosulfolactate phosphatase